MMEVEHKSLQLFQTKPFQATLRRLARIDAEAHRTTIQAMGAWATGLANKLPCKGNRDDRVPHAVRYRINKDRELVTYEHAGQRVPLTIGTTDELEKWLNRNRGRDFTVNTHTQVVRFIPVGPDAATIDAAQRDTCVNNTSRGPILARISDSALAYLKLSPAAVSQINSIATFESFLEDSQGMWDQLEKIALPDEEARRVLNQVIVLLLDGQVDEAIERLNLFCGRAKPASEAVNEFAMASARIENCDFMVNLTGISAGEIERLVGGSRLTDWMLFLHPEQRRLVEKDYNKGPARLIGVSGSGKTSVLIHRANSLAKKYDDSEILVLTLNAALVHLLSHLLDTLCSPSVRPRIKVETVYSYCRRVVKTIEPQRLIERVDTRSGEDLVACWNDFCEKPHALDLLRPVVAALEDREEGIDAKAYLLDELVWIRSGFGKEHRQVYLACDRPGRGIQFPKWQLGIHPATKVNGFPADTRQRVLRLLAQYEEYMRDGGLMDDDGVSLEAYSLKKRIADHASLRARCVLVDEVQDCSTVELAVIAAVPTHIPNGLFLTGDPVQKVYAKQHDLRAAAIDIQGRGSILRTNYRNTRQVLEAAYRILKDFQELSPVPKAEILEPEYAFRDGPKPRVFECKDHEEQYRLVLDLLKTLGDELRDSTCICSCLEQTLEIFESRCASASIPTYRIRGDTASRTVFQPGIKLVLMQDIKGYEFGQVVLMDLMDGLLPPKGMPKDERWRAAFQIYVSMTRARDDLLMSYVFNRSILLRALGDTVDECVVT